MTLSDDLTCDVLIAGSGASGFAAAVTAAARGLDVLMVEKEPLFGGTTAYSAGVAWIPGSRQAQAAGIVDRSEAALDYLQSEGGNRLDRARAEIFVSRAAEALAWIEDNTHAQYMLSPGWPDYHPDSPGGSQGGRSLGPRPFDGRRLGARFEQLRPPLATMMIMGGMMIGREDLPAFYTMRRSARSALHVAKLTGRYLRDRALGYRRGTRLSNGNALVAALALSAFERGVRLELEAPIQELIIEGDTVRGAVIGTRDGSRRVIARGGVVLACGGFPGSDALRARFFDHARDGHAHRSAAPATNSGDGFLLGARAGVAVVADQKHAAAWTPVSLVPQPDGSSIPFPHFFDRGKAGVIAVDRRGARFCNEANSYHDFVPALVEACRGDDSIACHLICDADAIARSGLGRVPPKPGRVEPHVRSGYLQRADTLAALAAQCGIDAAGLEATVARLNAGAGRAVDEEFGRGSNAYQRFGGTIGHGPNPCVAPVAKPPFYAVKLIPGDIGTFIGLRTDAASRALDASGDAIEGLYAVGNDAASFMGGAYPGAGITIGPALVFGHLAALDIAERIGARNSSVRSGRTASGSADRT